MVGIRKIAKEAGFSPATVSRVLSQDPTFSVSKQTAETILAIAAKYHYHPETNPTVSKRNKQKSILVITTHSLEAESHDPYFVKVHDGIIQEASALNMQIKDFIRFPQTSFDFKQANKYDGIIIAGVFSLDFYRQLAKYNPRLVLIDDYRYLNEFDMVRNSYFEETQVILDQLSKQGLKRIACIGGKITPMTTDGPSKKESYQDIRVKAYKSWMNDHHLSPMLNETGWLPKDGFQAMNELLSKKPEAILVASDQIAVGVYRAISQHHLQIPDDLQVISYNDSSIAAYLVPSLSSINPNSLQMGKTAVKMINDRIQSPRDNPLYVTLPAYLTKRESSR